MQTHVSTPQDIFSQPQHLAVPVFQRRYVWNAEQQWEPLWRDITRIATKHLAGEAAQHFLGAVVTQTSSTGGLGLISTHGLIDGQQRLTTLQLLIDAAAAELESADLTALAHQLTNLTHNPQAFGAGGHDALKVQHENDDRAAFVAVMSAEPPIDYESLPQSRLTEAHRYFAEQVREWLGDPVSPERAHALVFTLSRGLQIVVIALDHHEASQEIFETLNARGTPLTAADLIKNYVFQQIVREGGSAEVAFRDHWQHLERPFWSKEISIGRYTMERLSLFLNHWLVARTGEEVSTRSTFTRFKSWFEESGREMVEVLPSMHRQADLFERWVEESRNTQGDLDQVALFVYRTEAADVEAVKPLLLRLFDVDAPLPKDVASQALRDVESWVMRRALLRRPASEYSRVVAGLIDDLRGVAPAEVATTLRGSLLRLNRPGTYWPGTPELTRELATAPVYTQPKARVRAYLEAVEDGLRGYAVGRPKSDSRVRRGNLTVEHLLPQRWKHAWPVEGLSEEIERDAHVHRLGNLTLLTQSLNSTVSNGPWDGAKGKRAALKDSDTLLLTRWPREQDEWDEARIDARSEALMAVLRDTWAAPAGHNPQPITRTQDAGVAVDLRALVAAGSLPPGTQLRPREGANAGRSALVLANGRLELDGKQYDSPSGAGKAVLGRAVNGWTFWRLPDGRPLMDVRREHAGIVAKPELYRDFWAELLERLHATHPGWSSSQGTQASWLTLPYGTGTAYYTMAFTNSGQIIELNFATPDVTANDAAYAAFLAHREALESAFGGELAWETPEGAKSRRIRAYRSEGGRVEDIADREAQVSWFLSTMQRFRAATQQVRGMIEQP